MRRPFALAAAAGIGYLAGTIPFADLASKAAGSGDLREQGTGNPGAANAMNVLGKKWGYGVMVADVLKATVAATIGRRIAGTDGAHVAGTASVVGHCWPVWNGFKGGKGVATSAGQCLATFPAYFLPDLALAGLTSSLPWWKGRAYAATVASASVWTAAGVLWWRRGWNNLWGPEPTAALPAASAVTSVIMIHRFRAADRAARSTADPAAVAEVAA